MNMNINELFTIVNNLKLRKTENQYLLTVEGYKGTDYNYIDIAIDNLTPVEFCNWLVNFYNNIHVNNRPVINLFSIFNSYRDAYELDEYIKSNKIIPLEDFDIDFSYDSFGGVGFKFTHKKFNKLDTIHDVYSINLTQYNLIDIYNKLSHYDKKNLEKIFTFMSNVKGLQI